MPRPAKPDPLTGAQRAERSRAKGRALSIVLRDPKAIAALDKLTRSTTQREVVERALVCFQRVAGSRSAS